jgi:hypothetical protein
LGVIKRPRAGIQSSDLTHLAALARRSNHGEDLKSGIWVLKIALDEVRLAQFL